MVKFINIINYTKLLDESNTNKTRTIALQKPEYKTVYGRNIKGVMFKNKFYSKLEYDEIVKKENVSLETCITEIDKKIQELYG